MKQTNCTKMFWLVIMRNTNLFLLCSIILFVPLTLDLALQVITWHGFIPIYSFFTENLCKIIIWSSWDIWRVYLYLCLVHFLCSCSELKLIYIDFLLLTFWKQFTHQISSSFLIFSKSIVTQWNINHYRTLWKVSNILLLFIKY